MTDNLFRTIAEGYMKAYEKLLVKTHSEGADMPCLAFVFSDTSKHVSSFVLANGRPDQDLVLTIRMALERFHADGVIMLSDSWFRAIRIEGAPTFEEALDQYSSGYKYQGRINQDPERQEALLVVYETRSEKGIVRRPYMRTTAGIELTGDDKDFEFMDGRLTEWLKPIGKEITFTKRRKLEPAARMLFNKMVGSTKPYEREGDLGVIKL